MDAERFDRIARSLTCPSRRGMARLLASSALIGALAAVHLDDDVGARKKRKKKKPCDPCRIKKKGKCKGNRPDGTACPGGTCLSGVCNTTPTPVTRVDAECTGQADEFSYWDDEGVRFAQTFTPLARGQLVSAEMVITKEAGSIGDYILQLVSTDAQGAPTESVLASAFLANGDVAPGMAARMFPFTNPAGVEPGAEYALVVMRTNGTRLEVGHLATPTCAGQTFINFSPSGGVFNPLPGDLIYRTFVRS